MKSITELLAPIRERVQAATPGPWQILWKGNGPYVGNWDIDQKMAEFPYADDFLIARVDGYNNDRGLAELNAKFIASAPTDIARLVRAVEILNAELNKYTDANDYEDRGMGLGVSPDDANSGLIKAAKILSGDE